MLLCSRINFGFMFMHPGFSSNIFSTSFPLKSILHIVVQQLQLVTSNLLVAVTDALNFEDNALLLSDAASTASPLVDGRTCLLTTNEQISVHIAGGKYFMFSDLCCNYRVFVSTSDFLIAIDKQFTLPQD